MEKDAVEDPGGGVEGAGDAVDDPDEKRPVADAVEDPGGGVEGEGDAVEDPGGGGEGAGDAVDGVKTPNTSKQGEKDQLPTQLTMLMMLV